MNWRNLATYTCPLDGASLHIGMLDDGYTCTREGCTFTIGEKRCDEIVRDMKRPKTRKERYLAEENLSELNNLGHKVVSEDYSDEIAKRV